MTAGKLHFVDPTNRTRTLCGFWVAKRRRALITRAYWVSPFRSTALQLCIRCEAKEMERTWETP